MDELVNQVLLNHFGLYHFLYMVFPKKSLRCVVYVCDMLEFVVHHRYFILNHVMLNDSNKIKGTDVRVSCILATFPVVSKNLLIP